MHVIIVRKELKELCWTEIFNSNRSDMRKRQEESSAQLGPSRRSKQWLMVMFRMPLSRLWGRNCYKAVLLISESRSIMNQKGIFSDFSNVSSFTFTVSWQGVHCLSFVSLCPFIALSHMTRTTCPVGRRNQQSLSYHDCDGAALTYCWISQFDNWILWCFGRHDDLQQ